ncbi:MAG: DUF3500 domain-containing protein [Planctomycetales bacterium]|nr:DUF3500 domain-containing protein [Planctomycetales bacterium]
MKSRLLTLAMIAALTLTAATLVWTKTAWTKADKVATAEAMTAAAEDYVALLSDEQKALSILPFESPKRVAWHFIPMETRKGLRVRDMSEPQRKAAHRLLSTSLSKLGYDKAVKIMELEQVLAILENDTQNKKRDPLKYYFTVFGEPKDGGKWGLSVEGHHLSFNFVVDNGQVVGSTPQFMASNPTTLKKDFTQLAKNGLTVLDDEERLAFELVNALSAEQKQAALIADKAPAEIRAAGEAQPPQTKPEGVAASQLNESQKETLQKLIEVYVAAMPSDVAAQRRKEIAAAGFDKVHFAWAGALKPGVGHYYRVQGPTFLIEFVNTQPDGAGNPASHIHCVWRDPRGDFGIAL